MIDKFIGKYYFLSNFSNSKIEIEGLTFDNGEAAFHSFKDCNRREEFVGLNPSQAKKLGRSVKLREDWEEVKDHLMYRVNYAKFSQNEDLKEKLLATDKKELVEGNNWGDTYWGVCNGKGRNMLGRVLMLVRQGLEAEDRAGEIAEGQKLDPVYEKIIKDLKSKL